MPRGIFSRLFSGGGLLERAFRRLLNHPWVVAVTGGGRTRAPRTSAPPPPTTLPSGRTPIRAVDPRITRALRRPRPRGRRDQFAILRGHVEINTLNGSFWLLREMPNRVSTQVMLEVEQQIIEASPEDTGRFIASWIATVDAPSDEDPISKGQQNLYKLQGKKFTRKLEYYGRKAWRNAPNGARLYLTNNVPYANTLREGGPPYSVPPGWVEAAVRRGANTETIITTKRHLRASTVR